MDNARRRPLQPDRQRRLLALIRERGEPATLMFAANPTTVLRAAMGFVLNPTAAHAIERTLDELGAGTP